MEKYTGYKTYELSEHDANQARKDNLEWFSRLSPGDKIRAMEEHWRVIRHLQSLGGTPSANGTG